MLAHLDTKGKARIAAMATSSSTTTAFHLGMRRDLLKPSLTTVSPTSLEPPTTCSNHLVDWAQLPEIFSQWLIVRKAAADVRERG